MEIYFNFYFLIFETTIGLLPNKEVLHIFIQQMNWISMHICKTPRLRQLYINLKNKKQKHLKYSLNKNNQ